MQPLHHGDSNTFWSFYRALASNVNNHMMFFISPFVSQDIQKVSSDIDCVIIDWYSYFDFINVIN